MAVRSIKDAQPKKKRIRLTDYIWVFAIIAVAIFGIVRVCSDIKQTAATNEEIARIEKQAQETDQSNDEIREILSGENYLDYIEKIAREEHDYCKPGEEVFYNELYGE